MKRDLVIIGFILLVAGCEPISDPWTGENEMRQERERSDEQQAILKGRLQRGQTDR